ncbi:hypothetical protein ASC80_00910 [Afipia sp. Root123D2]|nr:hypothetical protein ASC80_00910 [Afipia sp. Root123D2]
MLFNFSNRMTGQVLVYLSDNASLYIGVERISQIGECSGWRHNNEGLRLSRPNQLLHGRGNPSCEAVLFDVMPIGRFDGASAACRSSRSHTSGAVAALFVSRRIFLFKNLFGSEVRRYRVAIISQEQGSSAITDKYQGVMWNLEVHAFLLAVMRR